MGRGRVWALAVPALLLAGCRQTDHAEGLEAPPTAGIPTAGPGSGDALAEKLHYMMQRSDPDTLFEDPSCPDVPVAEPRATVTCEMTVGEGEEKERREFLLHLDDQGEWVVFDG